METAGSLADHDLVRRLFLMAGDEILYRLVRVSSHQMTGEQARAMDDALIRHLARALMGENPQLAPAPKWSGEPCARSLKQCAGAFYDELAKAESPAPDENNPRVVMVLALSAYCRELYSVLRAQFAREDVTRESVQIAVQDVASRWALAAMPVQGRQ